MSDPEGVWPALFVPFTEDDRVDHESLRDEIRFLAEGGCHGVILFALASEPFKLSDEEKRELTRTAVDAAGAHDIPLFTSVTDRTTVNAVEWARFFEDAGVDGLMALPPMDGTIDSESVLDHLRRIGAATSLPVIVQHTSQNPGVPPEEFAALREEVPNVRIFKIEVNAPCPYIESLVEAADGDVTVLVGGGGSQMIEALDRGADGVVPGGALHELYLDVYRNLRNGDRGAAIEAHKDVLLMLNKLEDVSGGFIQYEKRMLTWRGVFATDRVRQPAGSTEDGADEMVEEYFWRLEPRLE